MRRAHVPVRYQQFEYWCTPACLQMIEASFGRFLTQEDLGRALRTDRRKGTDELRLVRLLRRSGYPVRAYERVNWSVLAAHIRRGARVFLSVWGKILWRNRPGDYRNLHHVVLTSVGSRHCRIIDPYRRYGGRKLILRHRLEASISRFPGVRAIVIEGAS